MKVHWTVDLMIQKALPQNHAFLDRDRCTLVSIVRVRTKNMMSGIILFLSRRFQNSNMFRHLGHDNASSVNVLFWTIEMNKAETGKIL